MPDEGWNQPEYEMEGESGGGGTVTGFPVEAHFADGEYGADLHMILRRSHPELTPNAKAEVKWSWRVAGQKERGNWTVSPDGKTIAHASGKPINAGTALGKLFLAVKNVFPYVEGFDPKSADSWLGLEQLGDAEWAWLEEPKRILDEVTGKWGPDPDPTRVNRTLVPVAYTGEGSTNGAPKEPVDLATLGTFDQAKLAAAVKSVTGKQEIQAALLGVPGVVANKALYAVILADPEGLREALVGGF